jgi:hypothetical protein
MRLAVVTAVHLPFARCHVVVAAVQAVSRSGARHFRHMRRPPATIFGLVLLSALAGLLLSGIKFGIVQKKRTDHGEQIYLEDSAAGEEAVCAAVCGASRGR